MQWSSFASTILKAATSVVLVLLLAEGALQILVRAKLLESHASMDAGTVEDEILGIKLLGAFYPEIDAEGFRNDDIPDHADVVALGDSQTYGYNATTFETWPRRLGDRSDLQVQNLGIGGFGPAQYYYLMDRALAFSPRAIVIGFYLGNDLMDACVIFRKAYWRAFAEKEGLDVGACAEPGPPSRASFARKIRLSVTYSELLEMIAEGEFCDGMGLAALHLARARLDQAHATE